MTTTTDVFTPEQLRLLAGVAGYDLDPPDYRGYTKESRASRARGNWQPHTNKDQTFDVVKGLLDRGCSYFGVKWLSDKGHWHAQFNDAEPPKLWIGTGDTPEQAICRAALKALEAMNR